MSILAQVLELTAFTSKLCAYQLLVIAMALAQSFQAFLDVVDAVPLPGEQMQVAREQLIKLKILELGHFAGCQEEEAEERCRAAPPHTSSVSTRRRQSGRV